MRSAGCSVAGLSPLRSGSVKSRPRAGFYAWIERRLPRRRNAQVGVPVVVPIVVDVEAIGIEIADVHAVAVRVEKFVRSHPSHQTLRFTGGQAQSLCPLDPECILGAVPDASQEHLHQNRTRSSNLYPLRALPESLDVGTLTSLRRDIPRGRAVTGPSLARFENRIKVKVKKKEVLF